MSRGVFIAFALAAAGVLAAEESLSPAPFITTPEEVVYRMLELAGTRPEDFVVDLGSGDGRIVIAAAQKFGARGLGIELDARLVEKSRDNARRAGVAERVSFVQGDVLATDFSKATVVTVYLLPGLINRLQPRFLERLEPGTRIVSHAFTMTGWRPDRSEMMRIARAHPGQGDESALHLWIVPAEVRGVWTGTGTQIRIHQNFQDIEVEGQLAGRNVTDARARLTGRSITLQAEGVRFDGRLEGADIVGLARVAERNLPLVLRRVR